MNRTHDNPRRALGKGLSALIPTRATPQPADNAAATPADQISQLPIDRIDPNPLQPRRIFQSDRLEELAQSIRSNGIIQPLVVRRQGTRYQLVAGERRWRAAKLAGLIQVPVIVQEFPDDRLLEITLIENIQREDLNPIETAVAFERLAKELQLSHDEIGARTGKDRTTITNLLRLLNLPSDLQQLVAERRLSSGHARCLLGLPTAALATRGGGEIRSPGLVGPPDGAHHPAHARDTAAQEPGRGPAGSQRQSRNPGTGARPRHEGAHCRKSQTARANRDRLLFDRRSRPHLRRHRQGRLSATSGWQVSPPVPAGSRGWDRRKRAAVAPVPPGRASRGPAWPLSVRSGGPPRLCSASRIAGI